MWDDLIIGSYANSIHDAHTPALAGHVSLGRGREISLAFHGLLFHGIDSNYWGEGGRGEEHASGTLFHACEMTMHFMV